MTKNQIILKHCDYFDTTISWIKSGYRGNELVKIRRFLCVFLREQEYKLTKIGILVNRDHSTVVHSINTHLDLIKTDSDYRKEWYDYFNYMTNNKVNEDKYIGINEYKEYVKQNLIRFKGLTINETLINKII